jgi:ankyrin repeat protein
MLRSGVVQEGWTPLHLAVQEGHLEVSALLLAAGAAVEATGKVSAA